MRIILRNVFGWLFLIFGIIGLFLPILQGILFIAVGVTLLAPNVPFFKKILHKLHERYPEVFVQADRLKNKIKSSWHKC